MAWTVRLSDTAEKQLAQLDQPVAGRIFHFLRDRLAPLDDPRSIVEALTGSRFGELWKYRQGDYRIVASMEDDAVQILVVKIGHRREVPALIPRQRPYPKEPPSPAPFAPFLKC